MMQDDSLSSMSVDELWSLHERVIVALGRKMEAEKATLENRLQTLGGTIRSKLNAHRPRRPYPKVLQNTQHRSRNTLFGQTLFEVLPFGLAQLGFEEALIPLNIFLMGM